MHSAQFGDICPRPLDKWVIFSYIIDGAGRLFSLIPHTFSPLLLVLVPCFWVSYTGKEGCRWTNTFGSCRMSF